MAHFVIEGVKTLLPVLVTSGYTDDKSHWPEIRDRGFPIVRKPYAKAELREAIKNAMKPAKPSADA